MAGGSQIKIGPSGITCITPAVIDLKASVHNFDGPGNAAVQMPVFPQSQLSEFSHQIKLVDHKSQVLPGTEYFIIDEKNRAYYGESDSDGLTARIHTEDPTKLKVYTGADAIQKKLEYGFGGD